jgi:hypothetical protein
MAELRLDLAEEKPSAEYLYMQSQMLDFLEFYKPRQDKPLELVKAQYEVKRNFEELSPEAQREVLQMFDEQSKHPYSFTDIVL